MDARVGAICGLGHLRRLPGAAQCLIACVVRLQKGQPAGIEERKGEREKERERVELTRRAATGALGCLVTERMVTFTQGAYTRVTLLGENEKSVMV